MILAQKIRLKPTEKQEIIFWKSAGVARWSYNYYISERNRLYNEWVQNGKQGKFIFKESELRKYINNVLKPTTHKWLSEVCSNVMKQGVKDADTAFIKYFQGLSGIRQFFPKKVFAYSMQPLLFR